MALLRTDGGETSGEAGGGVMGTVPSSDGDGNGNGGTGRVTLKSRSRGRPRNPATDPTALVRSLGDPPLPGSGPRAEIAIAAVVDRAAGLATALAATGGLLAESDDEDDPESPAESG